MTVVYRNLMAKHDERQQSDSREEYELQSQIDSISQRWSLIVDKFEESSKKLDRQYSSWLLFESELNAFRDGILIEIEDDFHRLTKNHLDFQSMIDLHQIQSILNQLRVRPTTIIDSFRSRSEKIEDNP